MTNDHAQEIAKLEAEIATLQQTLAILPASSTLQQGIAAELAERRQQLAVLQTGGVNLGSGNTIGQISNIVSGDQFQIEQVSQTVYQIVVGEASPAQLEQIRRLIGTRPGGQWDLYQAIAAGLGRANVDLAVDAQGGLRLVDDPAPERPPLDPGPFQELLLALRQAILPASGTLPPEELAVRRKRYCELIIEQFHCLHLEGLSTGTKPIILPLADVYVHLRAVAEVPEAADAFTPEERRLLKLLDERHAGGRADETALREAQLRLDALRRERWTRERLERFPIAKALADPQQRGLVILGDPGSGKSTLLQFLALSFAEGPDVAAARLQVQGADADRLPVFAPLAAYDDMLNGTPDLTIQAFLARYYDQRRAAPGLGPVFDAAIREGRALILLDGLDEVIEERRRRFVAEQATRFVQEALPRGNRVVVTSRVYGYRAAPLAANLPHITVLDFRKEEIATFARQWFRAFQRWKANGEQTAQAELLAQQEERQLLDEIGRNPGVERLATNPLLLTMLALLRGQVGVLPQRRIKLYDLYISALIESWQENRSRGARLNSSSTRIDLKEAEGALIELALWLQQHRPSGTATAADLLELLTIFYLWEDQGLRVNQDKILPPQRRQAEERARQFLHDMRQHSGLLIERGQGAFGFRHLTFQEYFAGRALARMLADERWMRLEPHLHSGRWREPLLLCAARLGVAEQRDNEANALVMQVLEAGSEYEEWLHRDLFLAADCAADDIGLSLPLLQRIAEGLWKALESRVPRVQRAALERLHGLALLRAGTRARLPEVQRRLVEVLLGRVVADWSPYFFDQSQPVTEALALLARLPLATDPELRTSLLNRLADTEGDVRMAAVGALGGLAGSDGAVRTALLDRLADADWNVRWAAVGALGGLAGSDGAVRTALLDRLVDDDNDVRAAAVGALGGLAGSDGVVRTALLNRLADNDWDVRAAAVGALGGLAGSDVTVRMALLHRLADGDNDVRVAAVGALGELAGGDGAVRTALLNRLADADLNVRVAAVGALGVLAGSDGAVRTALLDCLADAEGNVRAAAVEALGGLAGSDAAVRTGLLHLGTHPDWRTRQFFLQSARTLLPLQYQQFAVQSLSHLICQEAGLTAVMKALVMLGESDGAVRTALLDRLTNAEGNVRAAAVGALGSLAGNEGAVRTALLNRFTDVDRNVRVAAVGALGGLAGSDGAVRTALLDRLADAASNVRVAVVGALGGMAGSDGAVRTALLNRLTDAEGYVRAVVVRALGGMAGSDGVVRTALLDRLADAASNVRVAVVGALGGMAGSDGAVRTALLDRLADADLNVRATVVRALHGLAGSDGAVRTALLDRLADADLNVRAAAVGALGGMAESDGAVRTALLDRLADAERNVRAAAVGVLGGLAGSDGAVRTALLDRLADANWNVRVAAVEALGGMAGNNGAVLTALLNRLADADLNVRVAAVGVLGGMAGSDGAVRTALLDHLADAQGNVRAAAVRVLGGLAGSDGAVRTALLDRLADANWNVRWVAIRALVGMAESDGAVRIALLDRLADAEVNVRAAAVGVLGGLAGSDGAVRTALLDRLADTEGYVRAAALEVLQPFLSSDPRWLPVLLPVIAIDLQPYHPYIDPNLSQRLAEQYASMARTDPQLRATIIEQLRAEDWRLRAAAAEILRVAGEDLVREALPQLLTALDDRRGLESWPARLEAAAFLLNDDTHGEEALACVQQALTYEANALFPAQGAADVRQQAALVLGKLKALHHRRDVAARIAGLLGSETEAQVLDGLHDALASLAAAPELDA